MTTASDRAITELMHAKAFIEMAVLNVSVDLFSGANVEGARARDAIIQALSEIELAISEVDRRSRDSIPEPLSALPC
ncbi:MAG: hypothetical protein HYR85_25095 [Planctomycetes bacterium]|nr:hypothetical protein [Planctomycetota bacterium]MBI3843294.1 hypothetical protein [Planctomycetota bacterium]